MLAKGRNSNFSRIRCPIFPVLTVEYSGNKQGFCGSKRVMQTPKYFMVSCPIEVEEMSSQTLW